MKKPGFQQLLKEFDPQYVLPLRKYFSNTAISTLHAKTREMVVSEVGHAQHFAATTDSGLVPPLSHTLATQSTFIDLFNTGTFSCIEIFWIRIYRISEK